MINNDRKPLEQCTTAQEILRELIELHQQRNALYRDNYKAFGAICKILYPDGLGICNIHDFNRFGIVTQIIGKLIRYCYDETRNPDHLNDLIVYTAMLQELELNGEEQ